MSESISNVNATVEGNSAKIINVTENVISLAGDLGSLTDDLISVKQDVVSLADDVAHLEASEQQQDTIIEENYQRLDTLFINGRWCGYNHIWHTAHAIITYEETFFSQSNMNTTGSPLNIDTGVVY